MQKSLGAIRLIIADHQEHVRGALTTLLQELSDVALVAATGEAEELLTLAQIYKPDVILLEDDLPGRTMTSLVIALHNIEPKPFVIVMSSRSDRGRMALNAGADTFVSKGDGSAWLLEVLQSYFGRKGSG